MKNYLIIIFIACSTFVGAQSLELFYNGTAVTDTIEISVLPNMEAKPYIDIANVSNDSISVKWEAELSLLQGSTASFCAFGSCADILNGYNDGPQDKYYLHAGDTINKADKNGGAYITCNHKGNTGTSYMKFTFSDENNPLDKSTVVFKFVSGSVGVCDPNRQTVQTFETYPNPAKSAVFVKYGLNKESSNIELVLHSLTGSVIKTIPSNASENTIRMDVEDLAQGIYFCSLKVDGVISSSKKIVVTK